MKTEEFSTLQEQLATAQDQLKQYQDTIISQANELTLLRNKLCQRCNCNSTTPISGPSLRRRRSVSQSESARNVKRRQDSPSNASQHHGDNIPVSPIRDVKPPNRMPTQQTPIQSTAVPPPPPISATQITFNRPRSSQVSPIQSRESKFFVFPVANQALPKVTFVGTFEPKLNVHSVKFNPNGKYLAVGVAGGVYGDELGKVLIYDLHTMQKAFVLVECLRKGKSGIRCMSFSGDGNFLAIGYYQTHINVWCMTKKRVRNRFRGHGLLVSSLDFSPDSRFLISASLDKTVRIWNMRDGSSRIFSDKAMSFRSVKFSPSGQYVAAVNDDHIFRIWDIRTGNLVLRSGHGNAVQCVAFTEGGRGLVTGGFDKKLKHWDLRSLRHPQRGSRYLDIPADLVDIDATLEFAGHTEAVTSVVCSPNGKWILSGSLDFSVRIWDASNAKLQCKLEGHRGLIRSVDFSPMGDYLAAGGWEGEVSLWKCVN